MAKKSTPITTGAQVARRRVIVRSAGELFTLPVNPQFADPNKIDEDRGVSYTPNAAREVALAEAGIAIAVQTTVFHGVAGGLRGWLGRQFRRRGGAARFVDELLALEPAPAQADPHKFRMALLRSVERAGPAHKSERRQSHGGIRNLAYQRRIAHYVLATTRPEVVAGVTGLWELREGRSAREEVYRGFRTDPDEERDVQAVLAALVHPSGAGFIQAVIDSANERGYDYGVELLDLHGLHVELTEKV